MKLVIPYSFLLFTKEVDESFDIMIKYGDEDTYDFMREGYVKNGDSFWNDWSLGMESLGGYYVSSLYRFCVIVE